MPYLSIFELSECLHSLGEIYFDFGNWELAEKYFNMALSKAQEQGYENLEEMSTLSLQLIDNERQSWDLEEQSYQLRLQSQHENYDQGRMQDFYQFLDDYNRQAWGVKAETYKKQLQFYAESPSFPDLEINITETTGNLGEAEFYIGNFESAEEILKEALAKMQDLCMVKHTAVFVCMKYKVTGFEAGGRRQLCWRQKNNLIFESSVLYLIYLKNAVLH